ncbi:neuraminidase-like domain-containing protein [Bradyrhizobium sp. CCGE-LA001]|uniref:Tc toxin subunit A-related protein n=1 Tax=Bradyrhizobium sp. CCGE-LA001 TaxID=1223566 RepID=UPI000745CA99|nr:neuraminidase-like domain-containing protein [Bradyrhizobium sp. CCGE-LA001]AMA60592.1 hypothetical protein BCCGELA001_33210 [Bradyrhizobium sp. CCGE-LA001]
MSSLQFFIYLLDQTQQTGKDELGPVSVEFYERKIDGSDEQLLVLVNGAYVPSLPVPGATQLFTGEDPLTDMSGTNNTPGVLDAQWKPWAEVWTEYKPYVGLPANQHTRVRKRVEVQRSIPLQGNFDFQIVVKRDVKGTVREIGRSELFRNCRDDLTDLSPMDEESLIWIGVPSAGQERLPGAASASTDVQYERVRGETANVLKDEGVTLTALSYTAIAEIAAQSVSGLDVIGMPPPTPAKKLYDPDSDSMPALKTHGIRLALEAEVQQRKIGSEQAARDRAALVAALSTGFTCQQWTADPATAGRFSWLVPVDPAIWNPAYSNTTVRVDVTNIDPLTLRVPAAYFYAVSKDLDAGTLALERYNLAAGNTEVSLRAKFRQAQTRRVIGQTHSPITDAANIDPASPSLSDRLAARRLQGLAPLDLDGRPQPSTHSDAVKLSYANCKALFDDWLGTDRPDDEYWKNIAGSAQTTHFQLIRQVVCAGVAKPVPVGGVAGPSFAEYLETDPVFAAVTTVDGLKAENEGAWAEAFKQYWAGDIDELAARQQWQTLLLRLRRYLATPPGPAAAFAPPGASKFSARPASVAGLKDFFDANPTFRFDPMPGDRPTTAASIKALPITDESVKRQLLVLYFLDRAAGPGDDRLLKMEALYFRGFTDPWPVARLSEDQFKAALLGTLAYADALGIHGRAVTLTNEFPEPPDDRDNTSPVESVFRPVNHDGLLTDCMPAEHLSPFGPAGYARALLDKKRDPTVASLGAEIAGRRGDLGALDVTAANTFTPVPAVDVVNEALESLVGLAEADIDAHPNGELPAVAAPAIFQTSIGVTADELTAVPEHSTPSAPADAAALTRQKAAYDRLREDFSSFTRPYHQPLDITRSYLEHMGSRRYDTMRTFRKDIHEFVKQPQDMANAKAFAPYLPPEFDTQTHLRRYPVRIDTAREYLKLSVEEHREVFTETLNNSRQKLWQFWGYESAPGTGHNDTPKWADWLDTHRVVMRPDANARPAGVRRLSEFLLRSALSYREFRDLVACGFVPIMVARGLPEEEPCDIGEYEIDFAPLNADVALERLAVFLRLWRLLRKIPHTDYSFEGILQRLRRAREQMRNWDGARASIAAIEAAVRAFIAAFEKAGTTPVDPANQHAASDAVRVAFAALPNQYVQLAAADAAIDALKTRLERLESSANAQVTDDIRTHAGRIKASLTASEVARKSIENIETQAEGLAVAIASGEVRTALKQRVRELRVSLADGSDALDSLADLPAALTMLDGLLPAASAAPVIRNAKAQIAAVLPGMATVPNVKAAATAAGQDMDNAVAVWWPSTIEIDNAFIQGKLDALTTALKAQLGRLGLLPAASNRVKAFAKELGRLPLDQLKTQATVDKCEELLTALNEDRLQDEIRDTVTPVSVKIDSLPATFPGAAAARERLRDLIDLINGEPRDGSFAGPLGEIEDLLGWWEKLAATDQSFLALKQTCDVLGLYNGANINADFIRQLAAMQMLRDDYALCLIDVLPLWLPAAGGADTPVTEQAKKDLAAVIQERANCYRKEPKKRILHAEEFGEIADLTSLRSDAGNDNYPAFLQPTHTLRFVEVCFKIAHSDFSVGELSFLYLNRHLTTFEDDPFRVETVENNIRENPFADKFSDCTDASMLRLQRLLRGAAYGSMISDRPDASDGHKPTWDQNGGEKSKLKGKFALSDDDFKRLDRVFAADRQPDGLWSPTPNNDDLNKLWLRLADELKKLGYSDLDALKSLLTEDKPKFTTGLLEADVTRYTQKNPAQPKKYDFSAIFAFDPATNKLSCTGLLDPVDILTEATRLRKTDTTDTTPFPPCKPGEVTAIRDLFEQPRRTLAKFSLILPDQREAARRLLRPKKAADRMKVFVRYFFIFFRQQLVVADHLAAHVLQREPVKNPDVELDNLSTTARYLLLHHIEADENWKDNSGAFQYPANPNAKAIAGILGLRGTGIWTTFSSFKPPGPYTDVFNQRFDRYVAQVPGAPGLPNPNYGQLQTPPAFPVFPPFANLPLTTALMREISGSLNYLDHANDKYGDNVGPNSNDWLYNVPKPLRVPEPVDHLFLHPIPPTQQQVELRSGYQLRSDPADKARYGGAVPYYIEWNGRLQVTIKGEHRFVTSFKLPDGEEGPLGTTTIPNLTDDGMRIEIAGATKEIVPLHAPGGASDSLALFGNDADGAFHTAPVFTNLEPRHYDVKLTFVDYSVDPSIYEISKGPSGIKDRHVAWVGVFVNSPEASSLHGLSDIAVTRSFPKNPPGGGDTTSTEFFEVLAQSLFIEVKEARDFPGYAGAAPPLPFFYPEPYYFSSIRDIRRSYQRAFKAVLFCHRFRLVEKEVAFLLSKGTDFRGIAHTWATTTGNWESRKLNFDFNQWSVGDAFRHRPDGEDVRQYPEAHMPDRVWPLFDQWERFHDYVQLRSDVSAAATPLWQLFSDAANPATPPTAQRLVCDHLGLKASVAPDALLYTIDASPDYPELAKTALKTEEWPIRVWQAAQWQYARQRRFAAARGVAPANCREWARFEPNVPSLREYITEAYLENGPVRRYANLAQLNGPLRERARLALVGYLTSLDRCTMPQMNGGPPFACSARDLSERLLLDVETGTCAATPRFEEACAALRTYVQRLRLGLEEVSTDDISRDFLEDWDLRLAEYRRWEAWQYRSVYPENYREAYLINAASHTESFAFLERHLQQESLTADQDWDDLAPPLMPAIPGLVRWIDRLPSLSEALPTKPDGYENLTRRDRALSRTALSPAEVTNKVDGRETNSMRMFRDAPLELDGRFVRLQCSTTDREDDFYFWLVDGAAYDKPTQDAGQDWEHPYNHDDYVTGIPASLLGWDTRKKVRLAWCRIRDGIADDVRVSDYGVPLAASDSNLKFDKRDVDLLVFQVDGAAKIDQRFVYDPDENIARVLVQTTWNAGTAPPAGGLSSFPHFMAAAPGAAASPATFHAPALLVQKHLRLHDRGDAAREWLEFLHKPLACSNGWLDPKGLAGRPNARVLVLNWLENILDIGESQLAGQRLSTTELARETFALARKVLGDRPRRLRHQDPDTADKLRSFVPESPPLNRRLALLWDRTDRLATAIQRCENSRQIINDRTQRALSRSPVATPAYGDMRLHDGWMWRHAYDSTELDRDEWLVPPPHYRFNVVLQKALELCAETRSFGAALMSAFERGDAEELALLRSRHEVQINRLLLDVRRSQWREADWQQQALQKAREILEIKKQHIEHLIQVGLISDEQSYFAHMEVAKMLTAATEGFEIAAQVLLLVPEVYVGVCSMVKFVSGQKYSASSKIGASLLHMLASVNSMDASIDSMRGSFARREEEWRHQLEVVKIELEQVRRQILAADRRQDIALRELNIHQDTVLNAQEIQRFQQSKFTNAEHFCWLQDNLAGLYREMFDVALAAAKDAENAFRYERHYASSGFLASVSWTNYREGMTAGDHLLMALRRMEQTYLQQNVREYELGKSVSLRLCAPDALVSLRLTGTCEVDLPEWMLDLEMPGHYRRRIKNVALSVLCATGPYHTVNAKLTLLSDAVRLSPQVDPQYPEQVVLAGDPRFVRRYAAHQSIVTTSAQNDTGLFETNLRDERYLPFEGAGMISRWRIEMDPTTTQFDPDSLTDVVLHFRYTAMEGGAEMREQARTTARQNLPVEGNPANRYLDIQHDFPAQWTNLREGSATRISVQVDRDMFPWSRNNENVVVEELDVYFKPEAGASLPPLLEIKVNGQPCEAALVDQSYGPVYHVRLSLSPSVIQSGTASASIQLEIAAPVGAAVPQPEVLLVCLKYFFAPPKTEVAPCERFASLN